MDSGVLIWNWAICIINLLLVLYTQVLEIVWHEAALRVPLDHDVHGKLKFTGSLAKGYCPIANSLEVSDVVRMVLTERWHGSGVPQEAVDIGMELIAALPLEAGGISWQGRRPELADCMANSGKPSQSVSHCMVGFSGCVLMTGRNRYATHHATWRFGSRQGLARLL